jgi:hypothetical protein
MLQGKNTEDRSWTEPALSEAEWDYGIYRDIVNHEFTQPALSGAEREWTQILEGVLDRIQQLIIDY